MRFTLLLFITPQIIGLKDVPQTRLDLERLGVLYERKILLLADFYVVGVFKFFVFKKGSEL